MTKARARLRHFSFLPSARNGNCAYPISCSVCARGSLSGAEPSFLYITSWNVFKQRDNCLYLYEIKMWQHTPDMFLEFVHETFGDAVMAW